MKFVNESKVREKREYLGDRQYTYDRPSKYLFIWSRLFQAVVSQAGTFMLTGKFHTQQSAIYKTEGGCNIPGIGDLVLAERTCYFDTYRRTKSSDNSEKRMAELISKIVLEWNPEDPIESMIKSAAERSGTTISDLKKALESMSGFNNPFSGNALASFFDWNPFSDPPIDREYDKWCRITFNKESPEKVDQNYADIDLGREYRDKINALIRKASPNSYQSALCCSPRRNDKGELSFWINTGRNTQIDGWKTELQIETFLRSDGILVDQPNR